MQQPQENSEFQDYDYSRQTERILEDSYKMDQGSRRIQNDNQLWKKWDHLAQKNNPHSAIYWVKKQQKNEDGSMKVEKWVSNTKYIGDWKDNQKFGFGIQFYGNNDKYEGGWENNMRNGQGTFWICEGKNKLRREYTGDWTNDKKTGRGTMFYGCGDRYDGIWLEDRPHGEGRMIFSNGDVYEGMWFMGKRSGYGVLTKRNGDHFEGHWVNDKREGQGSYFFSSKNQVFVGEWVDDMPKTGVYSEVEDPYTEKPEREKHFTDPYILPSMPQVKLKNPTNVLQTAMENVRKDRTIYRAKHIPVDNLYEKEELAALTKEFGAASNESNAINVVSLQAILYNMDFEISTEELCSYLERVKEDYNPEEIEFDTFAKLIAIILEDTNQVQRQHNYDPNYVPNQQQTSYDQQYPNDYEDGMYEEGEELRDDGENY